MKKFVEKGKKMITLSILAMAVMCGTALAANIDAIVPASLPITVSADGSVVTATNASIQNYGSKPLLVSSINVAGQNGWSLATKDTAATAAIGDKVIAMAFNGQWSDTDGTVNVASFDKIASKGSLSLKYDAKVPAAKTAESKEAATATFVVKDLQAPTMAAGSSWYKSTENRNTITKITFMDSYTPSTAADEQWFADVDNTGSITCYRTGTEIVIAGNGAGKIQANADSSYMFSFKSNNNGFTKLTCIENLASLLDTSNVSTMNRMFSFCKVLTDLDLSAFDTSQVTDMWFMFYFCKGLTSLDLSTFDTSQVTNMSFMFSDCSSLTVLGLSTFDTSQVTNMCAMFYHCKGLTNLDLSTFDTSQVTNMGFMFSGCSGLASLDLSGCNTFNVTDTRSMFSDCSGLITIYASDKWNTDKVTRSNDMFTGCTKLKGDIAFDSNYVDKTYAKIHGGYLTIKAPVMAAGSSWYKSTVDRNTITKITFMDSYTPSTAADETWFADVDNTGSITCYRTGTEIIIAGNGAGKIQANADSSYMFSSTISGSHFTQLTSIENLPSFLKTSMVTNTSYMFASCSGLTSLDVSGFDTSKVTNMKRMFYNCKGLTSLDVSKFSTSNVTTMSFMFGSCRGLTSLSLSNFDTSNVTDMSSMFGSCSGLTSLSLSNFDTSNVTNMSSMFSYCSSLTSLSLSSFDTSNVSAMSFMFQDCSSLSSLDISGFNTSNVTNMRSMFSGCSKLTNLDVSNFNTSKVINMDSMFRDCRGLSSLDVSNFNTSKVTDMSTMFYYCSGLSSLDLTNFDTSNVIDMGYMFNRCNSLSVIYASDKWSTDQVTSSNYMFYNCTKLKGDIAYNSSYTDKTYAKTSGGYLTYKAAIQKTLSLNVDPNTGAVTSYDVSTSPMSTYKEMIRAVAAA